MAGSLRIPTGNLIPRYRKEGTLMKILLLLVLALPLAGDVSRSPGGGACSSHPCTLAVTCPTSQCAASDIQTAINEAQLGDTITIQAGVAWTVSSPLILYRKTVGSGQVTIRTSTPDSMLPAAGVRITPAYAALMPQLQLANSNASMVTIEQTANAVEHYNFIGIWFSAVPGADSPYALVDLWVQGDINAYNITGATATSPSTLTMSSTSGLADGDRVYVTGGNASAAITNYWKLANVTATTVDLVGSVGDGVLPSGTILHKPIQSDASQTPNDFTFDRCLFLTPALSGVRQGLRWAGRSLTLQNSYCDQIKGQNDSQCLSLPSTPGPVTVTNNYLGGGPGETIVGGGAISNLAGPTGTGQNATDVTITHNAIYKDPALYRFETWNPSEWVRKGKVIDGGNGNYYIAYTSGTTGTVSPAFPTAPCANPLSPDGTCSVMDGGVVWERDWFTFSAKWTMKNLTEFKTANGVTMRWNTMDGSWGDGQNGVALVMGIGRQGFIGTAHTEHFEFANNVVRNHAEFATIVSSGDYGDGITDDINIHDNLVLPGIGSGGGNYTIFTIPRRVAPPYFSSLRLVHNTIDHNPATGYWHMGNGPSQYDSPVITDNLFNISGNAYPLICSYCPAPFAAGKGALDTKTVNGYTFAKNVLAGEDLSMWPTGNYNEAWGAIGFTDIGKGDYSLQNRSRFVGLGTDGKNLGADTTQLPAIRNLTVTPTDRLVLFTWSVTEPIRNIACVIEVSASRDLSTTVDDLDPTRYVRPETSDNDRLPRNDLSRMLIVGANAALASGTTYWYRLHCGGAFEQGSFTTLAPLTGLSAFNISKQPKLSGANFQVEWGTSYSRTADTISGGGLTTATCNARGGCLATVEVPAGSVAYYRIREHDANGEAISGRVVMRVAVRQGN